MSQGWMHSYGSEADKQALLAYFYQIDTDRSGTIDGSELQRALNLAGERSDPEYVGMLLRMFGKQNGGTLSFDDFNNVVGFMRHNKNTFQANGGEKMDLAAVERAVAETHRGFPGLGSMMPIVGQLFGSMGGAQAGGVTADNFMMIQTFMSVIRNMMGGGGGSAGGMGMAGLLGGMGGMGGLAALMGGGGAPSFGGAAAPPTSHAQTNHSSGASSFSQAPPAYGGASAAPSYGGSAAPSFGGGSAAPSYGSSAAPSYGGPPGYGGASAPQTSHAPGVSGGGVTSAGGMNSILDQIMGANLGGAGGSTTTTSYGQPQTTHSQAPPSYGQPSYGAGQSAGQSYGGASGYGQPQQQQQGAQALAGFQAPSGYGAPAGNPNAGPAFTGVD